MQTDQEKHAKVIESLRPSTRVLYDWVLWRKQAKVNRAFQVAVLRKGDNELKVYEYPGVCAVVKKALDLQCFVRFHPWKQPFAIVVKKLVKDGWKVERNEVEVRHAH